MEEIDGGLLGEVASMMEDEVADEAKALVAPSAAAWMSRRRL